MVRIDNFISHDGDFIVDPNGDVLPDQHGVNEQRLLPVDKNPEDDFFAARPLTQEELAEEDVRPRREAATQLKIPKKSI